MTKESPVGDKIYSLHVVTLEPNAVRGNHSHIRDEFVCVLGGEGTCQIAVQDDVSGAKERILVKHDPMLFKIPKDVIHAFKNTGSNTVYLICFYTTKPDPGTPVTVKKEILI